MSITINSLYQTPTEFETILILNYYNRCLPNLVPAQLTVYQELLFYSMIVFVLVVLYVAISIVTSTSLIWLSRETNAFYRLLKCVLLISLVYRDWLYGFWTYVLIGNIGYIIELCIKSVYSNISRK